MGDSFYSRCNVTVKHNLAQSTLMESSRKNRLVKDTRTSVKGRLGAALLWIIELLAMVPKVWMHKPCFHATRQCLIAEGKKLSDLFEQNLLNTVSLAWAKMATP